MSPSYISCLSTWRQGSRAHPLPVSPLSLASLLTCWAFASLSLHQQQKSPMHRSMLCFWSQINKDFYVQQAINIYTNTFLDHLFVCGDLRSISEAKSTKISLDIRHSYNSWHKKKIQPSTYHCVNNKYIISYIQYIRQNFVWPESKIN